MLLAPLFQRLRLVSLKVLLRWGPAAEVHGIRLGDAHCDHPYWDEFVAMTRTALEYIEASDPRRYAWVKRTIQTVMNGPLVGRAAVYLHSERTCVVDIQKFIQDRHSDQVQAAVFAMVLVHEATHGRLFELGIPYNKRTRVRVEKRCHREQQRFLKRCLEWITGEKLDGVVEKLDPFDLAAHEKAWNTSLLQQIRGVYSRHQPTLPPSG